MRLPGGGAAEHTVDAAVSLTDLAPTVLELAGLEPRPGTDTWSLVPYAISSAAPPRPPRRIFLSTDLWRGTTHYYAQGVVDGRYKLIRDLHVSSPQLYDLESDPLERTDVAPAAPTVAASLLEAVEAHAAYRAPL